MFFTQLFVGVELAPRLRDLSAIIERWTPDVIVHEVAEPAAPIAATAAGLPYVTSGFRAVALARDRGTGRSSGRAALACGGPCAASARRALRASLLRPLPACAATGRDP